MVLAPEKPLSDIRQSAHTDRRLHPRSYKGLAGHIVLADGKALKLPLQSITLERAQLGCSGRDRRRIELNGWPALNGQTVDVGLRVELPTGARETESFETTCRLMFTRRVTQKRFCIGLAFTDLETQSRQTLIRYLLDAS